MTRDAHPALSVVIASRNRRERLEEALGTLAAQSFPADRFEVVVVLDGSSDGSRELVKGIDVPYELMLLEQEHMGLAASRNRGAREAMQRMIVFLDDDIVAEPGFLAEHARAHRESPDEHIALGYYPPVVGRERLWELALRSWWEDHFRRKAGRTTSGPMWTSSTATPRCPLRSCSRPAATTRASGSRQDWEFGIRLLSQGVRLAYYPMPRAGTSST